MVRAQALGREVALVPEGLAGGAVEAAVAALLDVAGGLSFSTKPCTNASCSGSVVRMKKSLEAPTAAASSRYARRQLVHVLLRGEPALLRRLGDLGAVLVGAGEEEDVLAPLAVVPRQHVGGDGRVGVAVVRLAVHVVDGSGDVEAHAGESTSRGAAHAGRCAATSVRPRAGIPAARRTAPRGCRGERRAAATSAAQVGLATAESLDMAATFSWTTACRTLRGASPRNSSGSDGPQFVGEYLDVIPLIPSLPLQFSQGCS